MQYAVLLSALAAATMVSAQTPDGCSGDYSGTFEYNPVALSGASKRDLVPLHKVSPVSSPTLTPAELTFTAATNDRLHIPTLQHAQRRRPHRPM